MLAEIKTLAEINRLYNILKNNPFYLSPAYTDEFEESLPSDRVVHVEHFYDTMRTQLYKCNGIPIGIIYIKSFLEDDVASKNPLLCLKHTLPKKTNTSATFLDAPLPSE